MFKSKRKRKYWSNNYKPTWISFMSFCFLSRMLSRSCCSSSVRSVITNIQEELEVIAWFHWPGGIRAYNIQSPTDSTPTSNPLTNNDQHMYPTRAKHKLDVFLPLLDQSSNEVCHSIPSRGCMSNENCKSIVYGVIRKIAPPENTLIFVCNARTTTMLQW